MENTDKSSSFQKRKETSVLFDTFLSKINILHDPIVHKTLLSQVFETDHFIHRKSFEPTEQIPLKFISIEHYVQIWLKLFYEETKSQIYISMTKQAREPEQIQILGIKDCQNSASLGFKLFLLQQQSSMHKQKTHYEEGTLVMLSPNKVNNHQIKPEKNCNYPHLIGLTIHGQGLTVKAIFNENVQKQHPEDWQQMVTTKKCYLQQICSIDSLQVQYYTLSHLSLISQNLFQIILHPHQHSKQIVKKFKVPQKLDNKLKTVFDGSQCSVIHQCLKQKGITLIHGPPGTGKTKTVFGILSALLSSYKKTEQETETSLLLTWKKEKQVAKNTDKLLNPWLYQGYSDWRNEPYIENEDCQLNLTTFYSRCDTTDNRIVLKKKDIQSQLPKKVLICAPSNTSVDEIITKLIKQQLIDNNGKALLPNFVRIGDHYHQSLKQYSLNFLSQKAAKMDHSTDFSRYRQKIINDYQLIFSTLSQIGNNQINSYHPKFDTVIIDNADHSIQISNLIPLLYGCQRLILLGDPNQFPPKLHSTKSFQHNYNQSLLQRMIRSDYPIISLNTQYRMHPTLNGIIGPNFYGQKFNNWEHLMEEQPKATPSAFIIFHVEDASELYSKKSFSNKTEAMAVKDFAMYLTKYYDDIGIISPYTQQVALLHSLFTKNKKVEIKSFDQWREGVKDVIILSTVRSKFVIKDNKIEENTKKSIGLLGNWQIITSSLSKSKNLFLIFGDINKLLLHPSWQPLINQAIHENQVYKYKIKQKKFIDSFKQDPTKYLIKSVQ